MPVKVNWIAAEKPNVTLAAEPMAAEPADQPGRRCRSPTQPTKDKPEAAVNLDVKIERRRRARTPSCSAATPRCRSPSDPMAKGQGAERRRRGVRRPDRGHGDPDLAGEGDRRAACRTTRSSSARPAELTVKVDRQYDFAGEFKVKFVLPKGVTGVDRRGGDDPGRQGRGEAGAQGRRRTPSPAAVNNAIITVTAMYAGSTRSRTRRR